MTDRRPLFALLDALFRPSDIREMFAGGFSWLLNNDKYVRYYTGPNGGVIADPIFIEVKAIVVRELSNVLVGIEATPTAVEIRYAVRDTLRRESKRLTLGITSADLTRLYYPLALGVLSAIDVTFDGAIRATLVPEGPYRLVDLEHAIVVTKPIVAFGYMRNAKEYPPSAVIPTAYGLIDQYLTHITIPPLRVDPTPLKPALFAPASVQPVHDIPARIKVGLVSILSDASDVAWKIENGSFWAETTVPERQDLIKKRLAWALQAATKAGTSILVIPELNLDRDLEQFLRTTWAEVRQNRAPLLLIGGLLHRPSEATPTRYRNQPILLTEDGNLSWPYWKREGTRWPFSDGYRDEALEDDCTHLVSLDTALGRLCIVICRDFTLDTTFRAIAATRANLVVVPAMTTPASVALFRSKARDLADASHAFTIFCNSSIHLRKPNETDPRLLGFVHANTRMSVKRLASHTLPSPNAAAVLGIYTLRFRAGVAPTSRPRILWTPDAVVTHKGYPRNPFSAP